MLDFVHFLEIKHLFNIITAPSPAKADPVYILTVSCRGTIGDDSDQGHQDSLHPRTHTLDWTGLTLWAGLDSVFTFPWRCYTGPGSAQAELGLHWMSRGLGFRGTSLVTKLNQVNKTVFVFFPCFNLVFPRLDDVILHFHPVVASTSTFACCILLCIAQHIINSKLSLCTESYVVYIFTKHHSLNHGSK